MMIRTMVLAGALLASPALAQDVPAPLPAKIDQPLANRIISQSMQRRSETEALITNWTAARLTEELTTRLKDRTAILFQPGHGVYVEYTAADGRVFMWYSGNRRAVHGTWSVVAFGGHPQACFHYAESTNPVTQVYEPTECPDASQTLADMGVIASRQGDVFNLRSDKLPFVKGPLDIPALP